MSIARKLTLLFVAIVALPMTALAILVVQISRDSRDGKTDALLAEALTTARSIHEEAQAAVPGDAERIAGKAGDALQAGDRAELEAIARAAVREPGIASVTFLRPGGVIAAAGPKDAIATAESDVRGPDGLIGTVRVSALTTSEYLADVKRLTGRDAALVTGGRVVDATAKLGDADFLDLDGGDAADVELPDGTMRAAALALDGPLPSRLVLLTPHESGFVATEPLIALVLLGFFALVFFFIAALMRDFRNRVGAMLEAARRIGSGDFSGRVPVEGNDEMAGLAREFNKMSARLSTQMGELSRQREEIAESVQRIGEAFASRLDRKILLEIVIETATSACGAQFGKAILHDRSEDRDVIFPGDPADLGSLLERASAEALSSRGSGSAEAEDRHAIAHAIVDRRAGDEVLCTLAVARHGASFSDSERETLRYLVGQTTISIENIGLHERLAEQAVTDDLTGIPNHRHFSEWIERELARIDRFGGELSLVLLDVDNFKAVNDTYGHLQGDRVLSGLGRVLREESRDIDEAARYGGEEFVLALPGTDAEGAIEVAERLRRRIEETQIRAEPGGATITVTASLGVASMPQDGSDPRSLIAAADAALYRAKRFGKNRVVATVRDAVPIAQGIRGQRRSGVAETP